MEKLDSLTIVENTESNLGLTILQAQFSALESFSKQTSQDKEKLLLNLFEMIKDLDKSNMFFERGTCSEEEHGLLMKKVLPKLIRVVLNENFEYGDVKNASVEFFKTLIKNFIYSIKDFIKSIEKKNTLLQKYSDVWEKLTDLFSEERFYYKSNSDATDGYMQYIYHNHYNPKLYLWRQKLQVGDKIDCMVFENEKSEKNYKVSLSHWTRGTVIENSDNKLKVSYDGTKETKEFNLSTDNYALLPYKSMSNDYEWKESLSIGDEFDFLDGKNWYLSTVMDVKETLSGKIIKYGLRIYRPEGKNLDKLNNARYIGWSETFDKEILVHDPKVRKPYSMSKRIVNKEIYNNYPLDLRKFNELEASVKFKIPVFEEIPDQPDGEILMINKNFENDSNNYTNDNYDNIHLKPSKVKMFNYFIPKKLLDDRKTDIQLVKFLYFLVENNFHLEIIELLDNLPETEFNIFIILTNIYQSMAIYSHIKFAIPFCENFTNKALIWLNKFSRSSARNFNKQKIEMCIKNLKDSLFRLMFENDVNATMEKWGVEFGVNCIHSEVLDMKLLGLKIITDYLGDSNKAVSVGGFCDKHLPVGELCKMVIDSEVLKLIFKNDSHHQLINASTDLMRILFVNKTVDVELFKTYVLLLKTIKDTDTKNSIYKALKTLAVHWGIDIQRIFIEELIINSSIFELTLNDIEIVSQVFNTYPGSQSTILAFRICCWYLSILMNSYGNSNLISNRLKLYKQFDYTDLFCSNKPLNEEITTPLTVSKRVLEEIKEIFINQLCSYDLKDFRIIFVKDIIKIINTSFFSYKESNFSSPLDIDLIKVLFLLSKLIEKLFSRADNSAKDDILSLLFDSDDKTEENHLSRFIPNVLIQYLNIYYLKASEQIKQIQEKDFDKFTVTEITKCSHNSLIHEFCQIFIFFSKCFNDYFNEEKALLLFDLMVINSISTRDSQQFFYLLNQHQENKENKSNLGKNFYEKIFSTLLKSEIESFINLNKDFVKNIWKNFLNMNNEDLIFQENKPEKYSSVSCTGQQLLSYSYDPDKKSEFKILVKPFTLKGFGLIWKLLLITGHVAKNIVTDLLKLFVTDLEGLDKYNLWEDLIIICIKSIEFFHSEQENTQFKVTDTSNNSIDIYFTLQEKKMYYINAISTCLNLITSLIEETEIKGVPSGVKSHSSLIANSSANIKVFDYVKLTGKRMNEIVQEEQKGKKKDDKKDKEKDKEKKFDFEVNVPLNINLWELKKILAENCNMIPEAIKVFSSGNKDICEKDHGKILSELNFKDGDEITIIKNPELSKIPKTALLINNQMNPLLVKALKEIYCKFKNENGYWTSVECAKFTTIATDNDKDLEPGDYRVKGIMESCAVKKENSQILTEEGFLEFYYISIYKNNKIKIVWENLECFNFRNDLKHLNDPLDDTINDKEVMPRYLISCRKEFFDVLFHLQNISSFNLESLSNLSGVNGKKVVKTEKEDLSAKAAKLLLSIATNKNIYSEILEMKQPFNEMISLKNSHLGYILGIIECLLFDVYNEELGDSCKVEDKLKWVIGFVCNGGLENMINILKEFSNEFDQLISPNTTEIKNVRNQSLKLITICIKITKYCISLVFKMIEDYKENDTNINSIIEFYILNSDIEGVYDLYTLNDLNLHKEYLKHLSLYNFSEEQITKKKLQFYQKNLSLEQKKIASMFIEKSYLEDLENLFTKIVDQNIFIYNFKKGTIKLELNYENVQTINSFSLEEIKFLSVSGNSSMVLIHIVKFLLLKEEINLKKLEKIIFGILLMQANFHLKSCLVKDIKLMVLILLNKLEYQFVINLLFKLQEILLIIDSPKDSNFGVKAYFILYESLAGFISRFFEFNKELNLDEPKHLFLKSMKTTEERIFEKIYSSNETSIDEDTLTGYLKLIKANITNESIENTKKNEQLISYLVDGLLIKNTTQFNSIMNTPINKTSYVPIKTQEFEVEGSITQLQEIRKIIYDILILLISNESLLIFTILKTRFTELSNHLSSYVREKRNYNPFTEKKKILKYIGLKNPSCICYNISILQQLFHIPTFRHALIQVNDNKEETYLNLSPNELKALKNKPNYFQNIHPSNIDDNILHQLQRTFSYLLLSKREAYFCAEFCYSFKDWDGNPTNIRFQQDSQEFLSRLLDNLDFSLKKTAYKYLVNDVFYGKTCSQIVCKGGCGSIRNNFEDLFYLSVEVKNVKTLQESLNNFISEEVIEDYECQSCKKKVNLSKRTTFSKLPNVFFIHLKRFNFNYTTYQNEKINSRLEFPFRLNFKELSTEYLCSDIPESLKTDDFKNNVYNKKDEYYDYCLVGVNVHMGTAEGGHYISYTNIKRAGEGSTMTYNPDNEKDVKDWFMFNDSTVTTYDITKLDEECFGGASSSNSNGWAGFNDTKDNNRNAYMLVYERIHKTPIRLIEEANKGKFLF